jgi:hypothetical protein
MLGVKYFPLGIATGKSFCNRFKEKEQLINNFISRQHTIAISPRRYGKSSLVLKALQDADMIYEKVDLFVAVDAKVVEQKIITGVKKLITKITTGPGQAITLLKSYFKKLRTRWIIGTNGISIELTPEKEADSATNIFEALQALEVLLVKKKKKVVFFIDEFQEIGVLDDSKSMEGAIRAVAQESKNLIFVFSGSNRHILSEMVDDRSRPLYMLCDRINLGRISKEHYIKYINKVAMLTWNRKLRYSQIDWILSETECHPYYVNALCNKVWMRCLDNPPTLTIIKNVWKDYILQEEAKTAKELSALSEIQKKILILIANGQLGSMITKSILNKLNVSRQAAAKALKVLYEKDYLNKTVGGEYFIIDPLLKASLRFFYLQ